MTKEEQELERLQSELKKLGLSCPPTVNACRSILQFINNNSAMFGRTPQDRAQLVKKAQLEWIGKQVVLDRIKSPCCVEYITAKGEDEILSEARAFTKGVRPVGFQVQPFWAQVRVGSKLKRKRFATLQKVTTDES